MNIDKIVEAAAKAATREVLKRAQDQDFQLGQLDDYMTFATQQRLPELAQALAIRKVVADEVPESERITEEHTRTIVSKPEWKRVIQDAGVGFSSTKLNAAMQQINQLRSSGAKKVPELIRSALMAWVEDAGKLHNAAVATAGGGPTTAAQVDQIAKAAAKAAYMSIKAAYKPKKKIKANTSALLKGANTLFRNHIRK
jgi:hypothetical protein